MPDMIKTGKYIYELDSLVGKLSKDAYFVVSQDDLTRKITFDELKTAFNGDNDESGPNNYYSSEMIDQMFDQVYEKLLNMEQDFLNLSKKFEEVQTYVQNAYNELSDKIDNLDETINNKIDVAIDTINERIDSEIDTINERIDNEVKTLGDRITSIYDELNEKIDNLYDYGQNAPTTLATGKLYFQYF